MNILIKREPMLQCLMNVNSVVQKKQTLPILSNLYLKAIDNELCIIATNIEVEITTYISNVNVQNEGEITVSSQKMLDIFRSLPEEDEVSIETKVDKVIIKSNNTRFTLQALPPADFPIVEKQNWQNKLKISQLNLKQLIDNTSFSMATQDVRYYLNGLLFEIYPDKLVSVATDGHRLAKSEVSIQATLIQQSHQIIIPRKAIIEVNRLLENQDQLVTIEINESHIRFSLEKLLFTSKLIDGKFPDYKTVLDVDLPNKVILNRNDFFHLLLRTSILTNDKFHGIRLTIKDKLLIVSAINPEQEQAVDQMPLPAYSGEKIEIGFNVYYLMDILKILTSESVELSLKDSNNSCTLNSPSNTISHYLVMPMRL